jgi:site-specific recombinase
LLFLDYTISFLVIHFAHFTLATKQPAMTGPALAARLDDVADETGREAFVDETIALIRSQMAAVIGNLSVVFPVALAIQWLAIYGFERPIFDAEKATKTLESFSLLGPTPFYAALTGVLLWLSSLAAGWADNWFALHRLRDAIAYQRRLHFAFGATNASRIAAAISNNVAGVSANIVLGFMLGFFPIFAQFFGLPLDVRHVTLSTGSVAAAVGVLGLESMATGVFWWAVAGVASMGALNVGVSFALAFALALRSKRLKPKLRRALRTRVLHRLLRAPFAVFLPPAKDATTLAQRD